MKIDHVAIAVENIANSVIWYEANLNAKVDYQDESWAIIKIGNDKIALTKPELHPPHIAILVDSIDCFPKSVKIKKHRDNSQYAYISDPDGNVVEYIHYESD